MTMLPVYKTNLQMQEKDLTWRGKRFYQILAVAGINYSENASSGWQAPRVFNKAQPTISRWGNNGFSDKIAFYIIAVMQQHEAFKKENGDFKDINPYYVLDEEEPFTLSEKKRLEKLEAKKEEEDIKSMEEAYKKLYEQEKEINRLNELLRDLQGENKGLFDLLKKKKDSN